MGLGSFFGKVWSGAKNIFDNPATQTAMSVASVYVPPLHLMKFLTAYQAARRAEETLRGPGRGPEKFLQALREATNNGLTPREAKRWIEMAVMVLDGTVEVRDKASGEKLEVAMPAGRA